MTAQKPAVQTDRGAMTAERIQTRAARIVDPHLRRLLLAAGGDIIDGVLARHRLPEER